MMIGKRHNAPQLAVTNPSSYWLWLCRIGVHRLELVDDDKKLYLSSGYTSSREATCQRCGTWVYRNGARVDIVEPSALRSR